MSIALETRRAVTPQHLRYATLAAVLLAALSLLSDVLGGRKLTSAIVLLEIAACFASVGSALAMVLLASRIPPGRLPRWLPYVIAACCLAVLLTAIEIAMRRIVAAQTGEPVLPVLWLVWRWLPQMFVMALLLCLGYMRAEDAWKGSAALRDLQLADLRLSRMAAETRLKTLQARVDPQFLFDTLEAIETTYAADAARGEQMIDDLIVYLRAALPSLDSPTSSLAAECTLVRTWLTIELARHGDRFAFDLRLPAPTPVAGMPPMVLQPLVHEAVASLADATVAAPRIGIEADTRGGRLRVGVSVTSAAFAPEIVVPARDALCERVAAIYGSDASLTYRWLDAQSSQALLEIPHEAPDRDHR